MKYIGILVKSANRREGIGTILLDSCKKQSNTLNVKIPIQNKIAIMFFEKNGFKRYESNEDQNIADKDCYIYKWNEIDESNIKLVYFDGDINEKYLKNNNKLAYQNIDVKRIIEDGEIDNADLYSIKTYMKFRKKIESVMSTKKVLLYIDYNNYYKYLDDQIKEIAKIKKIDLKIVVCEPFTIENTKKNSIIEEIKNSYKKFDIIELDCSYENTEKDITLSEILNKKDEILVKKIQDIAKNV